MYAMQIRHEHVSLYTYTTTRKRMVCIPPSVPHQLTSEWGFPSHPDHYKTSTVHSTVMRYRWSHALRRAVDTFGDIYE